MKNFWQRVASRLGVVGELLELLLANKKWWLIPMILLLIVFGIALVFASASAVGPFIYTLF